MDVPRSLGASALVMFPILLQYPVFYRGLFNVEEFLHIFISMKSLT